MINRLKDDESAKSLLNANGSKVTQPAFITNLENSKMTSATMLHSLQEDFNGEHSHL